MTASLVFMNVSAAQLSSAVETTQAPNVRSFALRDDGTIPNNARLPLLVYKTAFQLTQNDPASAIERLLAKNQWGSSWRNGIYPFHHYHSTAHEVLFVYAGSATVKLGGEQGITETVLPGDVLVIPAGVGHKNLGSSHDFAIIGAYPAGQEWDICYGKPNERPQSDTNISRVPLPSTDPLYGSCGPLLDHWRK